MATRGHVVTYEVDPEGLGATGHTLSQQETMASSIATDVAALSVPGGAITVATELTAYASVWGDGLHALARELAYMGGAMATSATNYSTTEENSAGRYGGAGRLRASAS